MKALREVWGETLVEVANENPRLLLLDADVANSTKADIFAAARPERFIQLGIAEQNMVGTAVGLAGRGFVPWASSFTIFLTHRALDPIRMLVAQTNANVKLAAAYSGLLTGLTGRTHQDVQDLAIMRAMPNMTVLSPADPVECAAMIRWATDHVGPVYLRVARDPAPDVFDESYRFTPGVVHTIRDGSDVTLVSTGVQTSRLLGAADALEQAGVSARIVHVPTIKPVDEDALLAALEGSPLIVSVEEHSVLGGLGGLVAELTSERGGFSPLRRIGLQDVWTESAPNDFLLDKYGLSGERVAEQVLAFLGEREPVS